MPLTLEEYCLKPKANPNNQEPQVSWRKTCQKTCDRVGLLGDSLRNRVDNDVTTVIQWSLSQLFSSTRSQETAKRETCLTVVISKLGHSTQSTSKTNSKASLSLPLDKLFKHINRGSRSKAYETTNCFRFPRVTNFCHDVTRHDLRLNGFSPFSARHDRFLRRCLRLQRIRLRIDERRRRRGQRQCRIKAPQSSSRAQNLIPHHSSLRLEQSFSFAFAANRESKQFRSPGAVRGLFQETMLKNLIQLVLKERSSCSKEVYLQVQECF